jgi:hypothetical protein
VTVRGVKGSVQLADHAEILGDDAPGPG